MPEPNKYLIDKMKIGRCLKGRARGTRKLCISIGLVIGLIIIAMQLLSLTRFLAENSYLIESKGNYKYFLNNVHIDENYILFWKVFSHQRNYLLGFDCEERLFNINDDSLNISTLVIQHNDKQDIKKQPSSNIGYESSNVNNDSQTSHSIPPTLNFSTGIKCIEKSSDPKFEMRGTNYWALYNYIPAEEVMIKI